MSESLPMIDGRQPYTVEGWSPTYGHGWAVFDRPVGCDGQTLSELGEWIDLGRGKQFRAKTAEQCADFVRTLASNRLPVRAAISPPDNSATFLEQLACNLAGAPLVCYGMFGDRQAAILEILRQWFTPDQPNLPTSPGYWWEWHDGAWRGREVVQTAMGEIVTKYGEMKPGRWVKALPPLYVMSCQSPADEYYGEGD